MRREPTHAGKLPAWERVVFGLVFALMAAFVVAVTVSAAHAQRSGLRPGAGVPASVLPDSVLPAGPAPAARVQTGAGALGTGQAAPAGETGGTMSLTPSFPPEYHYSADGTRMVQVEGEDRAAYLYDVTQKDDSGQNLLIRYLDQGVTDVRFTDTSKGTPLQIIIASKAADGTVRHTVYDKDGNPMGAATAAQLTPPPAENPVENGPPVDQPPSEAPMPDGV